MTHRSILTILLVNLGMRDTSRSLAIRFLPTIAIFGLVAALSRATAEDPEVELQKLLSASRLHESYQVPHRNALERANSLFVKTLEGDASETQMKNEWRELGFRFLQFNQPNDRIWMIIDSDVKKRGWGAFAIRPDANRKIVLQSPHSFYDKHTGRIGAKMFLEGSFFAASWNTAHRSKMDMAHGFDNHLCVFTRSLAESRSAKLFVQLHGFAQSKRRSDAAANADIIVSNASRRTNLWNRLLTNSLKTNLTEFVTRSFPGEVNELGGTTNAQARILDRYPQTDFLHLELSAEVRKSLRNNASHRAIIMKSLQTIYDRVLVQD